MRRTIRNTLLIFVLVPTLAQSGMVKWSPHPCGDMARVAGTLAVRSNPARAGDVQHEHCRMSDQAAAESGERCRPTCIACGVTAGNDVTLVPSEHVVRVLRPTLFDDLATASVASIAFAPPTPPP